MRSVLNRSAYFLLCTALWSGSSHAQVRDSGNGVTTIRRISLLAGSSLEVEIAASGPIAPSAQVIAGPDRLVIDFPNALPAQGLHTLAINSGAVKQARVGLFSSNPPVTRVVLDLKSQQPYQLFPFGNRVVVKFGGNEVNQAAAAQPETIISIERPEAEQTQDEIVQKPALVPQPALSVAAPATPRVEVSFENGLLSIRSNKANMSEVLSEVHRRTGAEIAIPPGAETEQVFTNLGPGAPKEVLAALLNGSHFNFIVMGSERDPGGLRRVVLTPKQGGAPEAVVYPCGTSQPTVAQAAVEDPGPSAQVPASSMTADEPQISDTPTQPMPPTPPQP